MMNRDSLALDCELASETGLNPARGEPFRVTGYALRSCRRTVVTPTLVGLPLGSRPASQPPTGVAQTQHAEQGRAGKRNGLYMLPRA